MFHSLTNTTSFETIKVPMTITPHTKEQQAKLLKAKIAVALQSELGRVPKQEEIEQVCLLTRVMYKAVFGVHFKRREQKLSGQLPIF
jgi:DNA-directed RNA polymerase sigma subunit (sigma70/sigma32)